MTSLIPLIETPRLTLRRFDLQDAEFILKLLNEAAFLEFIGDKGVRNIASAQRYLQRGPLDSYATHGYGLYLTSLKDGTPIGMCGLVKREGLDDADVGFAFLSAFHSRGFAVESAAAVLDYGTRVLHLPHIVAITAPENKRSIAVLEKIGLKFERVVRLAVDRPELLLYG